jgi:arylsulfatase
MPQVINLRQDPFERFARESNMCFRWYAGKTWTFVPAQSFAAESVASLKEFPPRQKSGSFSVDQSLDQLQSKPGSGK